jgi:hypothetical protein
MVTTVRREIARKQANAPQLSPPNVMRPRQWQHQNLNSLSNDSVSSNHTAAGTSTRGHNSERDGTSRYHLPV